MSYINVGLGILSFLFVFGVFKLAGLTLEAWQGLIAILLILIYFEIIDLQKKK